MANKSRPHAVMCRLNDKELERYKELIDGVVKVFINADTDIDYKAILKSLE